MSIFDLPLRQHTRSFGFLIISGVVGTLLSGCGATSLKDANFSLTRETPAPVEQAPLRVATAPIPADGLVTVMAGDSLYVLAARYQISPEAIMRSNNLTSTELFSGQQLTLMPKRTHSVQITDSLYSISQRYAVSQYQLARLNNLSEPYELVVGQRLILPESQDLSILDIEGLDDAALTTVRPAPAQKTTLVANTPKPPRKAFVAPALGSAGFTWPVRGEVITEFGPAERGVHHDGIAIAANIGTEVTVTAPGTVAYIGTGLRNFGTLVLIKHDEGYISAYAHLDSVAVSEGDILSEGALIGQVGQTGNVTDPQLHFEIRRSRQPINPRDLITS